MKSKTSTCRKRSLTTTNRFTAVDGEGAGQDATGRQLYQLLRIGDDYIRAGPEYSLGTAECLDFILSQPPDDILISYYFDYDVTMILEDFPLARASRLFSMVGYTYWKHYGVKYIPHKSFSVGRVGPDRKIIKGLTRTIHDIGAFFGQPFLDACEAWGLPTPMALREGKASRGSVDHIGLREVEYSRIECQLLAMLAERLRGQLAAADLLPLAWEGPGSIAGGLMRRRAVPRRLDLERDHPIPDRVRELSEAAFYGGRFEVMAHGRIPRCVYQYDRNSAYPAAMVGLPPVEGFWQRAKTPSFKPPLAAAWLAHVKWKQPRDHFLGVLPMRSRDGVLRFPLAGEGIYWEEEVSAARAFGAKIKLVEQWYFIADRSAGAPLDFVPGYYDARRLAAPGAARVIKLGLNAIAGKLQQRVGDAPYRNLIWAGLMTARVRAALLRAAAIDPEAVVMLATDAIYSIRPLHPVSTMAEIVNRDPWRCSGLPIGPELGAWSREDHPDLFIVQPGLYWSSREKTASKGLHRWHLDDHKAVFEEVWDRAVSRETFSPPELQLGLRIFRGLRLAAAEGAIETAGRWVTEQRRVSFAWRSKRHRMVRHLGLVRSLPYGRLKDNYPYFPPDPDDKTLAPAQEVERWRIEAQPDFVAPVTLIKGE